MKCPFCAHDETQVLDSRVVDDGTAIRRRRRCLSCDKRFRTSERIERDMPIVVKRNASREDFDEQKIRASMRMALRKRSVAAQDSEAALNRIKETIFMRAQKEIRTDDIGELVMDELKALDQVAYVRFASVYRSFADIDEFAQVIDEMKHKTQTHKSTRSSS